MEGVEIIKDLKGNITEIRVDVKNDPDLAADIYHLIGAIKRAKETEKSLTFKQSSSAYGKRKSPMTLAAFNQMIRDAKASGEISQEAFFQLHPQWQKKEKSSLHN